MSINSSLLRYAVPLFVIYTCIHPASAQIFVPKTPTDAQAMESTYNKDIYSKPERIVKVRSKDVIVQNLVMGPEATQLWQRLQILIADPDIKDFEKLINLFDLKITEKSKIFDWRDPKVEYGSGTEYIDLNRLLEKFRFGIGISSGNYPKRKFLTARLYFNIQNFCLSKQEIQRLYPIGDEVAGTHSEHVMWPDKTGRSHGFAIGGGERGAFSIAASGCATDFSISQTVQIIEKEEQK